MKKIGIMTTGGDCSGLNAVIERVVRGAMTRGWTVYGIKDGTDGLASPQSSVIELTHNNIPQETSRLAGSILGNGHPTGVMNFKMAVDMGKTAEFNATTQKALKNLKLDALIIVGGNGSVSLAWLNKARYSNLQLVCIPKTIDMDMPLTDKTIGFDTAVQQLTSYCDQLLMTARSHHRWFVVQAMGRDCGQLALSAGVAVGAHAILIPEIKFSVSNLIQHIKNSDTDYGIIMVSEGVSLRGHSGRPADMIARELDKVGIPNRTAFPDHTQRAGDTCATDRILATQFADCALNAIENNETYVLTILQDNKCKTVSLADFVASGRSMPDPNIPGLCISNAYVEPDNLLLNAARKMGIYIGDIK